MRRLFLAAAVACAACHPSRDLALPSLGPNDLSALLVKRHGKEVEVTAYDLERNRPLPFDAPPEAELVWLGYEARYADLFFELLAAPRLDSIPRGIPRAQRAFLGDVSGQFEPFEPQAAPEWLQKERIFGPGLEHCVETGGCQRPDLDELVCVAQCPAPPAPLAPEPPALATSCGEHLFFFAVPNLPGASVCLTIGRADCPTNEVSRAGDVACAPVAGECPAGPWPREVSLSAVFVAAGASPGGDGSLDAPYDTIAAALPSLVDGDVVMLSKGEHLAPGRIERAIHFVGACHETRIVATASEAAISAEAPGVVIEAMRIESGRDAPAIFVAGELTLRGVTLAAGDDATRPLAIVAEGGALTIEAGLIDAQRRAPGIESAGRLSLGDVTITGPVSAALRVRGAGASLTAERLAVLHVEGDPHASGVVVEAGAAALVRASFIESAAPYAATAEGASLTLEDVVITGDRLEASGRGVHITGGARLDVRRLLVTERPEAGLEIDGAGSSAQIDELTVFRVLGPALSVTNGASVSVSRSGIFEVLSAGARVYADPSDPSPSTRSAYVSIRDSAIGVVAATSDALDDGDAVFANHGARVILDRVRLGSADRYGLGAFGDAEVVASDVQVSGARLGVRSDASSIVLLRRASLSHNIAGVCATDASHFTGGDIDIRGSGGSVGRADSCGPFIAAPGVGMIVALEATVIVDVFRVLEGSDAGLILGHIPLVFGPGLVELQDVGARVAEGSRADLLSRVVFQRNRVLFEDL